MRRSRLTVLAALALALLAAPLAAEAQQAGRMHRIGAGGEGVTDQALDMR